MREVGAVERLTGAVVVVVLVGAELVEKGVGDGRVAEGIVGAGEDDRLRHLHGDSHLGLVDAVDLVQDVLHLGRRVGAPLLKVLVVGDDADLGALQGRSRRGRLQAGGEVLIRRGAAGRAMTVSLRAAAVVRQTLHRAASGRPVGVGVRETIGQHLAGGRVAEEAVRGLDEVHLVRRGDHAVHHAVAHGDAHPRVGIALQVAAIEGRFRVFPDGAGAADPEVHCAGREQVIGFEIEIEVAAERAKGHVESIASCPAARGCPAALWNWAGGKTSHSLVVPNRRGHAGAGTNRLPGRRHPDQTEHQKRTDPPNSQRPAHLRHPQLSSSVTPSGPPPHAGDGDLILWAA